MPQRWEKVITRKDIVFNQFPTVACPRTKKLNNVPSTIKTIINDLKKFFAINGFSFSGITSLNFYKNWSKSERIITDILSPQLDVVFTSIKGRFLSLNKINKSVSAIIKSRTNRNKVKAAPKHEHTKITQTKTAETQQKSDQTPEK